MIQKASKTTRMRHASDSYLACIRDFPLRPLRTPAEYRKAIELLGALAGRVRLDAGEQDYLAALSMFVGDYEQQRAKSRLGTLDPLDALRYLMEENDMTTTDLGRIVGSRGLASEILNGKRGLSKAIIHRLAERFAVEPSLFL